MDYSLGREAIYYARKVSGSETSKFVFIMFALDFNTVVANTATPSGWLDGQFPGESKNATESLKKAFESALLIATNPLRTSTYETFVNKLKTTTKDPPVSSVIYEGAGRSKEVNLSYFYSGCVIVVKYWLVGFLVFSGVKLVV